MGHSESFNAHRAVQLCCAVWTECQYATIYDVRQHSGEFGYDYWTKKTLKFDLTFPANQDFVLVLINYINRRVKTRHGVYTLKLLLS